MMSFANSNADQDRTVTDSYGFMRRTVRVEVMVAASRIRVHDAITLCNLHCSCSFVAPVLLKLVQHVRLNSTNITPPLWKFLEFC